MSRARGFTLVELLVALAIFALITGFAYRGLNTMLESRAALETESRKWRDVAIFVGRIDRDLSSALQRSSHSSSDTTLSPISSLTESTASTEGLAITRSGSPLQESALAAPQRVAYRLHGGAIERLSWAGVDIAPRDEPSVVVVLKAVSAFSVRFLDDTGEWRTTWGLPMSSITTFPAAVEVTVQLASGEKIVRLADMPRSQ
jgi:general secretion pathway protein J